MTSPPIRIAISTCPNDTFAFSAMMNQAVDWRGLSFQFDLMDIAQLNQHAMRGTYDVSKISFHAALQTTDDSLVLSCGAALGFGVGPLVLASSEEALAVLDDSSEPTANRCKVLCPGPLTTATLLFKLFYPNRGRIEHTVFSQIMPGLEDRSADLGVCIHEGRFTFRQRGLFLVEDLGTRWEQETGAPLPLGGISAKRSLGNEVITRIQEVIKDSIQYAKHHPESALPTMRQHAQEFTDEILMQHVDLYVNDWTLDLGETGRKSLQSLSNRALSIGLIAAGRPPIEVLGPSEE